MPPETEDTHFNHILEPYAERAGVGLEEYKRMYAEDEVVEPELDRYFVHDRAVRESGHDTTYRFEGRCANLATIDLNSLVYKYEVDLAKAVKDEFGGSLKVRVRRGPEDVYWTGFRAWYDLLQTKGGVDRMIGDNGGWDSLWAKGVMVFDTELDEECRVKVREAEAKAAASGMTAAAVEATRDAATLLHASSPVSVLYANAAALTVGGVLSREEPNFELQNGGGNGAAGAGTASTAGSGEAVKEDEGGNDDVGSWVTYEFDESKPFFTVTFAPSLFRALARRCKTQIDKYLWNPQKSLYFDWDCALMEQTVYETVTCLWALWGNVASEQQASVLVPRALELFEVVGGLVSGTEESRGRIGLDRPNRQWDYPYGWAPHQMLAWRGLCNYGYVAESRRIAYRWLYTITKSFVDFNGVVPEKFDVVNMTHKVNVEYGNVGADFKFVVREGFGWMNASFQVGLTFLNKGLKRALGALTPPDQLFAKARVAETVGYGRISRTPTPTLVGSVNGQKAVIAKTVAVTTTATTTTTTKAAGASEEEKKEKVDVKGGEKVESTVTATISTTATTAVTASQ
ncbi:alpha,alpha-trehalase nth1 [Quaeritorhiza haematococci]|nr:alpha,alpha-trehalase nth1 [Quaeritorhiza haematococci]